jgi:hypothetical protein
MYKEKKKQLIYGVYLRKKEKYVSQLGSSQKIKQI